MRACEAASPGRGGIPAGLFDLTSAVDADADEDADEGPEVVGLSGMPSMSFCVLFSGAVDCSGAEVAVALALAMAGFFPFFRAPMALACF